MPDMKVYTSATEALIAHLKWLKSEGKLHANDIARKMIEAGIPEKDRMTGHMLRMLARGDVDRLVEHRAVAACRILGIQVMVVDHVIPDTYNPSK
jgi:hypothetical protein